MPCKIISFELKKKQYAGCQHINVLVDEDLAFIECSECGEKLDPIKYLAGLAKEERSIEYNINSLQKQEAKIKNRLRTKCNHCGKMTRI